MTACGFRRSSGCHPVGRSCLPHGLAWQVRKGEKGTQIEFWEAKAGRDARSESIRDGESDRHQLADERDDRRGNRLIHRVYTVFNAKQIDGIPARQSNPTPM